MPSRASTTDSSSGMSTGHILRLFTDTVFTQTAVSSASYQGANQVTTNIYQEAPVVGEKGMRQFVQMIREQFLQIDYYGVTV